MHQQKLNQTQEKIINIKGISWMLKSTAPQFFTDPSSIDQQFKLFKIKDQKKKWKKKINKKFQSVGKQIQDKIRNKYSTKATFGLKIQCDVKYIPNLREIKSYLVTKSLHTSKINTFMGIKQKPCEQTNTFDNSKQFIQKTSTDNKYLDKDESEKQLYHLRKIYSEVKSENQKVITAKNTLSIHLKQKQFMNDQNEQFFKQYLNWINGKVDFYNQFDIKQYEQDLIKKKSFGVKNS